MPVTVEVNSMTVVHMGSDGVSIANPDACKQQAGPAVVVLPLVNVIASKDLILGTKNVKCDHQSVAVDGSAFAPSKGDEPGALGGVASGVNKGKADTLLFSMDVKFEGKGVVRAMDLTMHNNRNTPPAPILQGPLVTPPAASTEPPVEEFCPICKKKHPKGATIG